MDRWLGGFGSYLVGHGRRFVFLTGSSKITRVWFSA